MTTTAIVTGGAGGMGLATAKILGKDHHVIVSDVDADRLAAAVSELETLGIDIEGAVCDITDRASVGALFGTAAGIGQITSVVHAAGVSPQMGSAEKIIRINAAGTVNITEAALSVAHPGLAVVNVASIAGHMLPGFMIPTRLYKLATSDPDRFPAKLIARASLGPEKIRPGSAYALSKNFVIWYSKTQAARFGERGARILSVSPGSFDTEMGRLEKRSGSGRLVGFAALRRFGTPEEIAELLAFCASDKPGYLTGIDILCDGGTKAGFGLKGMIAMARGA